MPRDARRPRDAAYNYELHIHNRRYADHEGDHINRDAFGPADRGSTLEQDRHAGHELQAQNGERQEKAENDGKRDFFGHANSALPVPYRQPRRRHEIEDKYAAEQVGDLPGHDDGEISGKNGHDEHGNEKDGSRPAMEPTTFACEQGHRSRNKTDHAAADMQPIGEHSEFLKRSRYWLKSHPCSPMAVPERLYVPTARSRAILACSSRRLPHSTRVRMTGCMALPSSVGA